LFEAILGWPTRLRDGGRRAVQRQLRPGRYGIDIVASPRHADGLVLSGPISRNMMEALQICWDAMPEPKLVIAVGACAISGGVFADGEALAREFLDKYPPSLYVPGCPAHPLTFISGIMDLLGIAR
jgi:Ni,Fe-hydrogenase III small subunit